MCVLRNLLEVHMNLNEYNKVKSSTVTAGYENVYRVMKIPLRGQSNQWD